MERKQKVTQDAVNAACDQLLESGKNPTVNAVIAIAGGSFSTVGPMVRVWKEAQEQQIAPVIQMPEPVTQAMQKAVADIWAVTSSLAGEEMARIQTEAEQTINKAQAELSEYAGEVTRLENELEQEQVKVNDTENKLADTVTKNNTLTVQITTLETRLSDRDSELERLRGDYEKLQTELIEIAKTKAKEESEESEK